MQFPESWLREFCSPPINTQSLADTLTMAGLEVEELRPVAPPFHGVVVGHILEVIQHPNADRLRVCQVDVGQPAPLTIVCGAPNARVGINVPCALVGAELPPSNEGDMPFTIRVGKLRGIESFGMLCSAKELKLSEANEGLLELSSAAPIGDDIRTWLQLDDTLFTLKLTPNLAHCLSIYGIAREVSALTGAPLKSPSFPSVLPAHDQSLSVHVEAADLCGRFSGRVVRGVNARASSPAWMVDRLARCGQRSVSPLVDISNYVMFEIGQPTHIFDLDKISGGLDIRWARTGETLKLLNGSTVALDEKVGVISDGVQVESLAGIMGGDSTAVSDETVDIYIEAAFWHPRAIAGRSRRFNFATDAGHRFERGVDPSGTVIAVERITELVMSICGGAPGPITDLEPNVPALGSVVLRATRATRLIGMPLTSERCVEILVSLGLTVDHHAGDEITVQPPSWRFDLMIEEDLVEEIARVVGYQNLPTTPPRAPITPRLRTESLGSPLALRHAVAALGYQETINFSFVEDGWERDLAGNSHPIRLLNPIASQMSVMRSTLLGSLLQVLKFNLDRKQSRVRAFEIGRVFLRDATVANTDSTVQGFDQPMRLAGASIGSAQPIQWGIPDAVVDFYDIKGDVEALFPQSILTFEAAEHPALHPGRCAKIKVSSQHIGYLGELHPRWVQSWGFSQAPVLFELDLDAVLKRVMPAPVAVDKQQNIERDLAVVVAEDVSHDRVQAIVRAAVVGGVLRDVVLFDIYRPKPMKDGSTTGNLKLGEKSLALRLTLNGGAVVLTEAQIDETIQHVVSQLTAQLGARLRG